MLSCDGESLCFSLCYLAKMTRDFALAIIELSLLLLRVQCVASQLDPDDSRLPDSFEGGYRDQQDDVDLIDVFDEYPSQLAHIIRVFTDRASFKCLSLKSALVTGSSGTSILPEDIIAVAAMGDGLLTGSGMWPDTDIDVRGASFATGADANFDQIPTFANALKLFNPKLKGASQGMGPLATTSHHQLNVAESGAAINRLPKQASDLVARLLRTVNQSELENGWILLFISVGTEEFCTQCASPPNAALLRRSLVTLRKAIPKLFIVLLGPVIIRGSSRLTYGFLKSRCKCVSEIDALELKDRLKDWRNTFEELEEEFYARHYPQFVFLFLPYLSIEVARPELLFVNNWVLLNRLGHAHAARWLWNSMIAGPMYNLTRTVSFQETYYCPSLDCPFFRNRLNFRQCSPMTISEYQKRHPAPIGAIPSGMVAHQRVGFVKEHVILATILILTISFISVFVASTIFYCHGINAKKGRFEEIQGV